MGGNTTNYVWDVAAGLPAILQDGTNTYVYGLGLISTYDGSAMTYRLTDGLGSTVNLCDSSGNVTVSYTYDAFGAIRSQTGSSSNYWKFAGEQRDEESGFDYLRARYYDPEVGRFLGEDPLGGGFAYVSNNPVNLVDPSGLSEVCTDWRDGLCSGTTVIADEFDAFYFLASNVEFWVPPQVAEQSLAPSDVVFLQATSQSTSNPVAIIVDGEVITCSACYAGDFYGMGTPSGGPHGPSSRSEFYGSGVPRMLNPAGESGECYSNGGLGLPDWTCITVTIPSPPQLNVPVCQSEIAENRNEDILTRNSEGAPRWYAIGASFVDVVETIVDCID